ncbi:MAG: UDP-2,3-diacylglucosamine diphosphatase LpxI [Elusimicrobia bacterium]|nr:UDP-2,3-diacylglucosamine diphosphatase LpxI [Elusimicrobiota bacterium]
MNWNKNQERIINSFTNLQSPVPNPAQQRIGLIAGGGRFPILFAQEAKRMGRKVVAIGIKGVTSPDLEGEVEKIQCFRLGQLTKPIAFLREFGVAQAVMAGKVQHGSLFGGILPDARAFKILARLKDRRTDSILGEIAEEFAKEGIQLLSSATFLSHLIPHKGVLTGRKPTATEKEDIKLGWRVAKNLSGLDVGQTVVVKEGTVVAVEGMEGTDACILRASEIVAQYAIRNTQYVKKNEDLQNTNRLSRISNRDLVVVKVAKPKQDFRFDLPVLGADTIETLRRAEVRVVAIEAGKSLILDQDHFIKEANELGTTVVAIEGEEIS